MTKRFQFHHISAKYGFTLVELMAVLAIMAILASTGAVAITRLVPSYQQNACNEERTQALRVFVSDWLETRMELSNSASGEAAGQSAAEAWLENYLNTTAVNCSGAADSWKITLTPSSDGFNSYTATLTCTRHPRKPATTTLGLSESTDNSGGIQWDGGIETSAATP